MPNMKVLDMTGKEVGTVELADSVFAAAVNAAVLHAAVRAYLLNQRQGTQSTLTRTEVSGGGKKPWRQRVQAEQDRVPHALPSGHTAAWRSGRSQDPIVSTSIKRSRESP